MFLNILKKRLREASTWKALLSLLTVFGLTLTDAQVDAIAAAGMAVYAALSLLLPDKFGDGDDRPKTGIGA